jgi:hypothetical protein
MAIPSEDEPNKRCVAAAVALSMAHILTVVGADYQVYPLDGLRIDHFFLVKPCCFSIACCCSPSHEESVPFRGNLRGARSDHFRSTDASCLAVLLVWEEKTGNAARSRTCRLRTLKKFEHGHSLRYRHRVPVFLGNKQAKGEF